MIAMFIMKVITMHMIAIFLQENILASFEICQRTRSSCYTALWRGTCCDASLGTAVTLLTLIALNSMSVNLVVSRYLIRRR